MGYFIAKDGEPKVVKVVIHIVLVLVILFILIAAVPFGTVGAGQRGIRLRFNSPTGDVLGTGLYFRIPFVERVVKMDVRTQKLEIAESQAYSKDLQVVTIHSVLNYYVDPAAVTKVYQQYNLDYETKIISPNLEAAVKQTVAQYSAEELLNKRAEVANRIDDTVKGLIPKDFIVTGYALVNEDFSNDYERAIEQKQVAQQNAEKATNDLKRIQIEADQRVAQAKAEAEAIKIQAEAITSQGGADYVKLKAIEKWSGNLPQYMLPNSTLPFINIPQ